MTCFTSLAHDVDCPACQIPVWMHTRKELDACSEVYGLDIARYGGAPQ